MLPQDIIRKKRDRRELSEEEIRFFVAAATRDEVSEGQIGAFTMAVYLNGMSIPETVALSLAMRDSGRVVDCPGHVRRQKRKPVRIRRGPATVTGEVSPGARNSHRRSRRTRARTP